MPSIRLLSALVAALGVWVGLFANPAAAEVETERMTWVEIRDAVAAGKTTIIIPTGGTEQNGPHMVTGKHNFIVREAAKRIAEAAGNALVAPVLAYVPEGNLARPEGHLKYPGTISVPPETFKAVLDAAATSFALHGFKLVVFLGDSGPNQEPQRELAAALTRRWAADGVRAINADNYYADTTGTKMLKAEGETDAAIGSHAAIRDTSELMAIFPDGVRLDKRVADKDGVAGDPARATAVRGVKLLDLKILAALDDLKRASKPEPDSITVRPESLFQRFLRWAFG